MAKNSRLCKTIQDPRWHEFKIMQDYPRSWYESKNTKHWGGQSSLILIYLYSTVRLIFFVKKIKIPEFASKNEKLIPQSQMLFFGYKN